MRILLVNAKCGFFGGVEQHIFDIVGGLGALGHTCHLAYGERSGRSDPLWRQSFECHELRELGAPRGEAFDDLVRRIRPDVVYVHKAESGLEKITAGETAFRRLAMIHDHDLYCPRRHKYTAWRGRVCHRPMSARCLLDGAFLRRNAAGSLELDPLAPKIRRLEAARRLDRLVVASRFMGDQLKLNGVAEEKILRLAPVPRRALDPSPDPEPAEEISAAARILFVGQLVRGKGVDLLLRALRKTLQPLSLDLVGDGNARPALEALVAKFGLRHRVRFHGWVDNSDLPAFYSAARCVVMPGRWPEPFGLVGLESMAQARPVIAFDVGGVSDWLEDGRTGFLVGEQDLAGLARQIDRLVADPALAHRLGQAGRRRYQERFLFPRYIRNLEAVLAGDGLSEGRP